MRVFIGTDSRQPIGPAVLAHSIRTRSSKPVSITFLQLNQLPITRKGLTEFTYSRYLVPWLCDYEGTALFLDADMLCLGDISSLFDLADENFAVQVVKNKIRFEWPSLMLFNCAGCKALTPDFVQTHEKLSALEWQNVGELPSIWNHLVGYDQPQAAQIVHFTKGLPVWDETRDCEYSDLWHAERKAMMSTCSFQELMGKSRHVKESE